MPTPYDQTRADYDTAVNFHAEKSAQYKWSAQVNQFTKFLKGPKVLDVGCGSGQGTQSLLNKGLTVEGLDFSGETIKVCRERFPKVQFYKSDMRNTKLPDTSYDGIWACASILNLSKADVPSALQEFSRILKKGGVAFISVKEGQDEKMIPDQHGERFFSFYTEPEIKDFIEKAGFKILQSEIVADKALTHEPSDKPNWICIWAEKD